MDESNAIRAIVIGVSTFIAMITISAVLTYYNTAKATVEAIGTGEDLSQNYSDYILDIILYNEASTANIDGADIKNILNYFYLNERVSINIVKMTNMGSVNNSLTMPVTYTNNVYNVNNNEMLYNKVIANIISSQKFKIVSIDYYDSEGLDIKNITVTEI